MDCTFETENGRFNYRVGAIVQNGRKLLFVRNPNEKKVSYYSVGGRVRFGESAEDAMKREFKEETSFDCVIKRMFCIHENFFKNDEDIFYHEISLYFLIEPSEEVLAIKNGQTTKDGPQGEYLEWIDLDNSENTVIHPDFFRTANFDDESLRHFVTIDYK